MNEPAAILPDRVVDRYAIYGEIASGGMATVHLGRLLGPVGFSRTVAVKCLHPAYAKDPEFVSMFLDEARLAARVRHPNVVATIDVVVRNGELFLVMEFVPGEALAKLIRISQAKDERIPLPIGCTIVAEALHGLHAAHVALSDRGEPLGLVHRDVSPQNVLVGTDGAARVIDFGVAKAAGRVQTTREGQIKGKMAYMAPEQLLGNVTQRADTYAAGLMLWEVIAGRRTFIADTEPALMARVLHAEIEPPSTFVKTDDPAERALLESLDAVVMRAVNRDPEKRFASAEDFAVAIEQVVPKVQPREVGAWVTAMGAGELAERMRVVAEVESASAMVAIRRLSSDRPSAPSRESFSASPRTTTPDAAWRATMANDHFDREVQALAASSARPFSRPMLALIAASIALVLVLCGTVALLARARTASNEAEKVAPSSSSSLSPPLAGSAASAASAPAASGAVATSAGSPATAMDAGAALDVTNVGHGHLASGGRKPTLASSASAGPGAPPSAKPAPHPQNPAFL